MYILWGAGERSKMPLVVVKGTSTTFTSNKITTHIRVEYKHNGNAVGSQTHSFAVLTLS